MSRFIILFLFFASNLFAQDNIIVSIRPLQSIIANLTDGISEPKLIIDHNESLHHYHPKFQVINNIHNSNFIVIIDRNFEVFMDKIMDDMNNKQRLIEVAKFPGVKLIKNIGYDHHHEEEHDHDHEECNHAALKYDYHLWLDVDVMKNTAKAIVEILSKDNPDYKEKYHANLDKLLVRLDNLDKGIREKLIDSKNKNYIAIHNAYKYFAKRYNLSDAIPVTIDHDSNIGAQTMLDLRKLVADHKVVCLFQEPQFDAKIIDSLAKNSQAKIGKLDAEWGPEETDIKDVYFDMMNNLADSFKQCLN